MTLVDYEIFRLHLTSEQFPPTIIRIKEEWCQRLTSFSWDMASSSFSSNVNSRVCRGSLGAARENKKKNVAHTLTLAVLTCSTLSPSSVNVKNRFGLSTSFVCTLGLITTGLAWAVRSHLCGLRAGLPFGAGFARLTEGLLVRMRAIGDLEDPVSASRFLRAAIRSRADIGLGMALSSVGCVLKGLGCTTTCEGDERGTCELNAGFGCGRGGSKIVGNSAFGGEATGETETELEADDGENV